MPKRNYTVTIGYDRFMIATVHVQASSPARACAAAIEHEDAQNGEAFDEVDDCGDIYVEAICEGKLYDAFAGTALPVPRAYSQTGLYGDQIEQHAHALLEAAKDLLEALPEKQTVRLKSNADKLRAVIAKCEPPPKPEEAPAAQPVPTA